MTAQTPKLNLNKEEREAIEWLHHFSQMVLNGQAVKYEQPVVNKLARMGIKLNFVCHTEVEALIRGKDAPFCLIITDAPWYIKGKTRNRYLPFQIKKRLPK